MTAVAEVAMATVLMAWELGGGLGHLMQLGPLAQALARQGHTVFAAVRHPERAEAMLGQSASLLAAPYAANPPRVPALPVFTFAHILHNVGWDDEAALRGLVAAWRNLYAMVRPDVILSDHAPTTLLAARGLDVRRVVLGSGFCVPPDRPSLPNLRPWMKSDEQKITADGDRVLATANTVLARLGRPPLERVTQLYGEVDETLLLTIPELDHYPPTLRGGGVRYWGAMGNAEAKDEGGRMKDEGGSEAGEPSSTHLSIVNHHSSPRVFCYLKNFAALPDLLAALRDGGHLTTVVCDGVPREVREKFAGCPTLRFEDRPLDLRRVAHHFDLAILNAGHGATAAMLLAGVPVLLVPIHLEQGLLARAAVRNTQGAAAETSPKDGPRLVAALNEMLASLPQHTAAARAFAARHASLDPGRQIDRVVERVEELLARRQSRRGEPVFAG